MTGCKLLTGTKFENVSISIRRRISRTDDKLIFAVGDIVAFEVDTEPPRELLESEEERMTGI